MHKLQKLILEAYAEVNEMAAGSKKLGEMPDAFVKALEKKYGEVDMENDFISPDLDTYYKYAGTDPETGSINHDVHKLPSFYKLYDEFESIISDIKNLMSNEDVRKDKAARELFELIKTNFRKLQSYLRTERPDQYAVIRGRAELKELHESFVKHASLLKEEKSFLNEANTPRYPEGKLSFADKVKAIVPLWKQYQSASGMEAEKIKDKISRYTAYDNEYGGGSYSLSIIDDAKSVEDVARIIKKEEDRLKKDGNGESDYSVKLLVPKVYFNVESGELSDNKNEWYTDDELKAGADQTSYTKGNDLDDVVFNGDYEQALNFAKRYPNLIKVDKNSLSEMNQDEVEDGTYAGRPVKVHMHGKVTEWFVEFSNGKKVPYSETIANIKHPSKPSYLNESLLDEVEDEPQPEEPGEKSGPVLEDATDKILGKFPTLRQAIIKLQTEDFKEFVETIDWISPRPTSFRINLKNGQDYILKWTGKSFEAQILGKRYLLSNIAEYQQALDKLAILYKEAPMKGAGEGEEFEPSDSGAGGGGGGGILGSKEGGGEGEAEGGEEGGGILGGEEGGGEDLSGEPIDFEETGEEPEA